MRRVSRSLGASHTSAPDGTLLVRAASAAVLAAIALAGTWLGGWPATVIVGALAAVIFWEWCGITESHNRLAIAYVAPAILSFALFAMGMVALALLILAAAVALAGIRDGFPWRSMGIVYVGVIGLGLLSLRLSPQSGATAILFLFAIVWATDAAAYFGGRAIGGPKLWPRISPNKTWAGAVAGLLSGAVAGVLVAAGGGFGFSINLLLIATALSAFGQAGDLFESAVKRRFGAKDSSRLIPGHGGLMDRVDSLTVAVGAAALIGWAKSPSSPATGLLLW